MNSQREQEGVHLQKYEPTSYVSEFRAGFSTFLTMSYILLVNPQILSTIGIDPSDIVIGTAVGSALGTLICGYFANLPFGLAPGMGLSAYIAFGLVNGANGLPWKSAMACCFYAGIIMGISAITGISTMMMKFIPKSVKIATVVGMGLLIALIGMQQIHLVVGKPDTLVTLGDLSDYKIWLAFAGILLTGTLMHRQVTGSILIGIVAIAFTSWYIEGDWPTQFISMPRMKFKFAETVDFHITYDMIPGILGLLFVGVFDVSGVLFGLCRLAGKMDKDNNIPGDIWVYVGSSLGTVLASLLGCSPIIVHVESAAGIKEGGKTGMTAIAIAFFFLCSLFFAPVFEKVPPVATSPVLIIIGAMMMGEATNIEWKEMDQAIPAFLTIIMMPFTFSIADGVAFGLGSAILLSITTGKIFRYCRRRSEEELLLPSKQPSFIEQISSLEPVVRLPSLILPKEDLDIVSNAFEKSPRPVRSNHPNSSLQSEY